MFAPLVFAKELFVTHALGRTLLAFVAFCLVASGIYVVNDLVDEEEDRQHPIKKFRPIPSQQVPYGVAKAVAAGLFVVGLGIGLGLGSDFIIWLGAYLALNAGYSFGLKKIAYFDAVCIASGFELRVLAGAVAAGVQASRYLLVVTMSLALFLAFGKRLHELSQRDVSGSLRASLQQYNQSMLLVLLGLAGLTTVGTYLTYTLDPHTQQQFGTSYLVATVPFVLIGVLRFVVLTHRSPHLDSPTEQMLRDKLFMSNVLLWALCTVGVIYFS